jgi:SAM-dependent methyltransferase
MDKALYDEMFALEQRHWWFAAKRQIVLAMLRRFLGTLKGARVYDVGCGCGMMLQELSRLGCAANGLDASETALEYCRARGVPADRCLLPEQPGLPPDSADAVLLLDVLEHVDRDRESFVAAMKLARPGGVGIVTVPAYQWLWTKRDEFHYHKRRYNRQRLRAVLEHDNVRIERLTYCNTNLFPLAMAGRLLAKIVPDKKPKDLSVPAAPVNAMLRWMFAAERWPIAAGVPLPWGLSLLAVVRRKERQ